MEFHSNAEYLSAFPPKLEDAGLEDCALPIERIQEAFQLAAQKAHAAAENAVDALGVKSIIGGDVHNPGPSSGEWEDASVDTVGIGKVGSCVETKTGGILEEGKDAIVGPAVDAKEDKLLVGTDVGPKLGEGGCIEGDLAGLGATPVDPSGSNEAPGRSQEESKGPILTGAYL